MTLVNKLELRMIPNLRRRWNLQFMLSKDALLELVVPYLSGPLSGFFLGI